MKKEIQKRIEQIRRGEVPEGYKRTKVGIVPIEWENYHFSDLFVPYSEHTQDLDKYPLYSLTIEDGITAKTERYERSHLVKKEDSYKIVRPNDFAYNPMNLRFGAVSRHNGHAEKDRQSRRHLRALPAVVPRPRNERRQGHLRALRS